MNRFCPIYFPTNVIFLDDDAEFLNALVLGLNHSGRIYKTYNDPKALIRNLNAEFRPDPFEMNWVARDGNEEFGHRMLDANISQLHQEIYRSNRFDEISVVVVDYHMPGMNGIEFFSELRKKNVFKILLTGHAQDSIGIEALNKGLIHQFVRKQDLNLFNTLDDLISKGQRHFFRQSASTTLKTLEGDNLFSDPTYLNLVERVCEQFNVVEYYLIDTQGSLLMFDNKGVQHVLFVASDSVQDSLAEIATEIKAPLDVIESFKKREKIFCLYNQDGLSWPEGSLWRNYLHEAHKLEGKNPIYYAIASSCFGVDISRARVFGSKTKRPRIEINSCGVPVMV